MKARLTARTLTAACLISASVLIPTAPAFAAGPSIWATSVSPGLPTTVTVAGLSAGQQYDMHADVGNFSPVTVTASSVGSASSTFTLPGSSNAVSVILSVTSAGDSTELASSTDTVQSPRLIFQHEFSSKFYFFVVGFAADEPLKITYSTPYLTGPTSAFGATTPGGPITTDGTTPFPPLTWSGPRPAPQTYAITVTGGTYGRSASATVLDPGTTLRVGEAIRVPAPSWSAFMLQSTDATRELVYDFGNIQMLTADGPNSFTEVALLPKVSPNPSYKCTYSYLWLATNGALSWYCDTGTTRTTLWTSNTAGTGAGNFVELTNAGILTMYNVLHASMWNNVSGVLHRTCLTPTATLSVGQRLYSGSYSLLMETDGNLVLYSSSGHALWSTRTSGTRAHLVLQTDGDVVLYNSTGHALWSTHTAGSGNSNVFALESNGNIVLLNAAHHVLWSSHT